MKQDCFNAVLLSYHRFCTMVVLLDLNEDSNNDPYHVGSFDAIGHTLSPETRDSNESDRPNPNLNSVSAALSCYP